MTVIADSIGYRGRQVDPTPRERPELRVLTGLSVTLEPLSGQHAADLWPAARGASDSWTWLPAGPFTEFPAFSGYVRFMSVSKAELVWVVRPHGSDGRPGSPSGWLALLDVRPRDAAIEIGNIWFPPGLSRTRAATEAMFLLLNAAYGLGYRRVSWKCSALNRASQRAARRLGFQFEGILRAHMVVDGHERDTAYFSMLDEEWPDRRAAISAWLANSNFDVTGQAIERLQRPQRQDCLGQI